MKTQFKDIGVGRRFRVVDDAVYMKMSVQHAINIKTNLSLTSWNEDSENMPCELIDTCEHCKSREDCEILDVLTYHTELFACPDPTFNCANFKPKENV